MKRTLAQLRKMFRRKGPWRLIRFLAGRLVVRRISSVVYDERFIAERPPSSWRAGEEFAVFRLSDRETIDPELSGLLKGAELAAEDWLFGVRVQGKWSNCGCAMFRSRQVRVLGENPDPLIGNCYTAPESRGAGLYRRGLNDVVRRLRSEGWSRVLIETDPQNWPSRKGIERAGFRQFKLIQGIILFNSIVAARVETGKDRGLRVWLI